MILYILSSFRHISNIASDPAISNLIKSKNILFVAREYTIKKELEKHGLPSEYFGMHLDGDEALECDKLACTFIKEWMLDEEGNDFTMYGPVSLGQAARSVVFYRAVGAFFFQLVLSLISHIKELPIAKIIYEESRIGQIHTAMNHDADILRIVARHYEIAFEIVRTSKLSDEDYKNLDRYKKFGFSDKDSAWLLGRTKELSVKNYARRAVSFAKRFSNPAATNILVTYYNPMQYYLVHAFQKHDDNVRYHFIDSWIRKWVRSKKHGACVTLTSRGEKLSEVDQKLYDSIMATYRRLISQKEYVKKFTLLGMDFSDYIIPRMEMIIRETFPLYINQVKSFKVFLKNQNIDMFLTAFDGMWYTSLLIDICKSVGIPTVEIHDGFRSTGTFISALCDYVLCWSESIKENYFKKWLLKKDDQVLVVGTPMSSAYRKKLSSDTPNIISGKLKILVGGALYGATYMGKRSYDPDLYLLSILEGLEKFEDILISIRCKKHESYEYYKWFLETYYPKRKNHITLESGEKESFANAIERHDIHITNDSTSVFEAVLANKYCISYQLEAQRIDPPFDGNSELMVARSPQELQEFINDILKGKEYTRKFNKREVFEKYLGPVDAVNERIYVSAVTLLKRSKKNGKRASNTPGTQSNQRRRLTDFKSNRARYKLSLLEWIDRVDGWVESSELDPLAQHFEKRYGLTPSAVRQHLKRTISNWYDFSECCFLRRLVPLNGILSACWYLAALAYLVFNSKKRPSKIFRGKLLIDDIEDVDYELGAFSKLIESAKFDVVYAATDENKARGHANILLFPQKKNYLRGLTLRTFWTELCSGVKLYRRLSAKLGMDVFRLAFSVINSYLYYESLFEQVRAEYCLSWRDYGAFSIKKDIFKRKGGRAVCAVQRSAHKYTILSAFIDLDIYFALGEWFSEFLHNMKGRIGRVVPIGSLLCELNLSRQVDQEKKYDIMWMDVPVLKSNNFYNDYVNDQLETYRWLARFAQENKNLSVAVKTRSAISLYRLNEQGELLLSSLSNVSILDGNLDSYAVSSKAKVIATFYSTMGYELMGIGYPVVFCDPYKRGIFVPDGKRFAPYCASSYDEFSDRLLYLLRITGEGLDFYRKDFDYYCKNSTAASEKIAAVFHEKEIRRYETARR